MLSSITQGVLFSRNAISFAWYEQYRYDIGDKWLGSNRLFVKEFGDPIYPSTVEFWVDKI